MIKSPKEKFQSSAARRDAWEQIVNSQVFEYACDAALLEMQTSLSMGISFETAAMSYHEILGANIFIRKLKTLHEIQKPPTQEVQPTLNYQAGV